MLPQTIKEILENWIKEHVLTIPCESNFRQSRIPAIPGEFAIKVVRRIKINIPGKSELVSVEKVFRTSSLSSSQPNIHADEQRLKAFLEVVDREFIAKTIDAESRLLDELNPPGFY